MPLMSGKMCSRMHGMVAQGRNEPVTPIPLRPSSSSISTKTNMRVSIDSPMPGRSISCRCRLVVILAIFKVGLLSFLYFFLKRSQPASLAVVHVFLAQPARAFGIAPGDCRNDCAVFFIGLGRCMQRAAQEMRLADQIVVDAARTGMVGHLRDEIVEFEIGLVIGNDRMPADRLVHPHDQPVEFGN